MNRKVDHPITRLMAWVGLSVLLPLIPVTVGVALTVLRREVVNWNVLLDGLELFLISLWLVSSTAWELSKREYAWEKPARMLLIAFAVVILIFLVLLYVDKRMQSLDVDIEIHLFLSVSHFLIILVMSVALQLYMYYDEYRTVGAGDSP